MAAEKSPAFQFYPKDFLTDSHVAGMSLQERGAYITLLCLCWQEQSLPMDTKRLANMVGVPVRHFTRLWPALEVCFKLVDGRLIQPRLERERQKQIDYRAMKAAAGAMGGRPKAEAKQDESRDKAEVKQNESRPLSRTEAKKSPPSSSSSPSSFPISDLQPAGRANGNGGSVNGRSKRPIFQGQRYVVFDWQLEDLSRLLGAKTEAFDLHSWFFDLDARAVKSGEVVPQRDGGAWLQAQTLAEARRRGLVVSQADPGPQLGKQSTRLLNAVKRMKDTLD